MRHTPHEQNLMQFMLQRIIKNVVHSKLVLNYKSCKATDDKLYRVTCVGI
jgi:hypothetical protein